MMEQVFCYLSEREWILTLPKPDTIISKQFQNIAVNSRQNYTPLIFNNISKETMQHKRRMGIPILDSLAI